MSSDISTNDEIKSLSQTAITSSSSRFGSKSHNMFFSRNVAHPRNLRFITGVAGSQICSIKEDQYTLPKTHSASSTIVSDPRFSITFSPSIYDENLIKSYSSKLIPKKKKERLLPPISFWSSSGLISDDTNRWRDELHTLASSVGLMTSDELKSATERLQKEKNNLPGSPKRKTSHGQHEPKPLTSEYSKQTGRLNETPKVRPSRGGGFKMPSLVFCVENSEREMWMIQVLCQILQTESMQDVQSWLVSAGPQEKDAARELIEKAIQGLQENGRIEIENNSNNKEVQVDLEHIKETLKRISDSQQQSRVIVGESNVNPHSGNNEIHLAPKIIETQKTAEKPRSAAVQAASGPATPAVANITAAPAEMTPLQRLLTQSQNYESISKNPKTAAVINHAKYALLPVKNETRPFTADVFRSTADSKGDRKLSNKIIKELVNFVEVERHQQRNSLKSAASERAHEKVQLFPNPPATQSTKVKLTKIPEKDAQILTIED